MRVNVYSQELTNEVELVWKKGNTGVVYSAVRLFLHSSDRLHCSPHGDDDRSAITYWLPRGMDRREEFAQALEEMALQVRGAPPEDGLD
jgi:hypothetical protein